MCRALRSGVRPCIRYSGSRLSWLPHSLSRDLQTVGPFGFAGELGSKGPPSTNGEEANECIGPRACAATCVQHDS